jgi:hypothetical protein
MGINIIKEEIKIIIETLGEQYAVVNQQSGKIPQIELDIVMANIRKLYERLCDLNKLNSADLRTVVEKIQISPAETKVRPLEKENSESAITEKEIVKEEKKLGTPVVEKEITPEIAQEETVETAPPEVNLEKTKEIIFELNDDRKEENKASEVIEQKTEPPIEEIKSTKSRKKDSVDLFSLAEKETLADKFKETQKSIRPLADKIANEKPDKTLADKIGKSSIINLKNAIGINDKFLFINELFKGDIQEYNKTIDKLNSFSKLEECTVFLEEMNGKFNWADKPDAYQKLEDLVIRKFL